MKLSLKVKLNIGVQWTKDSLNRNLTNSYFKNSIFNAQCSYFIPIDCYNWMLMGISDNFGMHMKDVSIFKSLIFTRCDLHRLDRLYYY
jgi:hypothetical protein